jgi:hypothetical protein
MSKDKEEMVTVEANGRSVNFEGTLYRPDKNDRLRLPRRALNHISAYGFFNPVVNPKSPFHVAFKEVESV